MTPPADSLPSPNAPPVVADPVPDDATDALGATTRRLVPLLALVLGLAILGGTTDLILDRPRSWWSVHVALRWGSFCSA